MSPLTRARRLAAGEAPVYVATRLYDPSGRYLGARLERGCLRGLRAGLEELGLEGRDPLTFLPFRDSNSALQGVPAEGFSRAIYDLDRDHIERGFALLAPLGDLQADSGIAFEVGYAAGVGTPAVLLWLNFFVLRYDGTEETLLAPPLLSRLATRSENLGAFDLSLRFDGREDYLRRVAATLDEAEAAVAALCRELVLRPHDPPPRPAAAPAAGRVHLEFGGGQFETQRCWAARLQTELERAGFTVSVSRRYEGEGPLLERAAADLNAAAASELVVTLADGPDMDGETAALQGYARGLGRKVLLYSSGRRRIYTGPEYDHRHNLMLLYSADRSVRRLDEVVPAVRALLG
ncbi:nucleoside 2-deoxyribosyltransferase [Oceanithermus desulfurans]